jgi:protein-disulfide isomerase
MVPGKLFPPVGPDDHALGPADAPVVLVEYGDYECPQCARAHAALVAVLSRLRDRVRYVFRNFPLTDIHPHARRAAEAAESVAVHAGSGAFWDMHDMLFANQDALEIDDLLGYADAAGGVADEVADDLSWGAARARVRADVESAYRSDVNGTPTFFVNGSRYEGPWTDPDALVEDLERAAYVGGRAM